ncbi:pentatricopeptide repeat-containing protein MRL1, chloroplastic isoform X2 [Macadamia integrifolia]|uniref:pentatricopeptide repeat-containing protein MRL1, chloroplastic isoform X2 n=1 Tax=Macadamia integrifolia TaxID=60698 RepID=UPI001C4FD22B|nr:pentatricopeptide repeat-containing protein MRL1, chloroplastic isoform X2 [Macadamia integrifolia]
MDVRFSAKAQTLTLVSCVRATPSSYSSAPALYCTSYSSCSTRCCNVRREFLGCIHRLRSPGIRFRRKKKFGVQIRPARRFFRAELYSKPIIFIGTIATIAAFTAVYLNFTRRKKSSRKLSVPEDSHSLEGLSLSKEGTVFTKLGFESRIIAFGKLNGEDPMKREKATAEETCQNGQIVEEEEVQLSQCQMTTMMHEETLSTKSLKSPGSGVHPRDMRKNIYTEETEGMDLTIPSLVLDEVVPLGEVKFAMEILDLPLEEAEKEVGLGSELPRLKVESVYGASTPPERVALAKTVQGYKAKHEGGRGSEVKISGCNFFRQSVREDIYTFYEGKPAGLRSASNFNAGSFHGRKDLKKGREFMRDMGERALAKNGDKNLAQLDQRNGVHNGDKHDASENLIAYNRMLRDGRLTDCVTLLEDMEQRGLLDMNEIYHAKFFKACKSQKAVKEAFRFTKLVVNPTLSTFNMLLSVCANSQDSDGAFEALQLVKEAGMKPDCKLYTTLISTCAKSGKVDAMFEVFHEMINAGVEPNAHTYGALIDGCAKAGQVAKAFGAYGIMRSKKVKPDRVVFNALITACGQSGAVDRAFDVLAEMRFEPRPVDPDHVTVGALIKTCTQARQVDRAKEVYNMMHEYKIKGTPEVYTIAVNSCSQKGDLEFALRVYDDMTRNGVVPDEMFLSALIDVAGHAGKIDVAFDILQVAKKQGFQLGNVSFSSLMGACSNAKNWKKALELYEDIKAMGLHPTVSTMNALITALCDGNQLQEAVEVLSEMKRSGIFPNAITYSVLLIASEKKDELELGFLLLSQAKKDGVIPSLSMCRCMTGMCLRRFEKAYSLGEPIVSFNSGIPQIDSKWTSMALNVYRETIAAGVVPTMEVFYQVLGCLQLPHDTSLRERLVENLGVGTDSSRCSNIYSLIDGFGEYDPRSFSLFEEAASLGVVPLVSFKESPIVVDARNLPIHAAKVYLLTVLKGLKHRFAAGARLPNVIILLPVEKRQITSPKGDKPINLAGKMGQETGAMLRRLRLPYQGNESYGKIRINGLALKRWFQPKLHAPFSGKPAKLSSSQTRLGEGISDQRRNIRAGNLSLEWNLDADIRRREN